MEAVTEDYNGRYNDDKVRNKGRFEGEGRGKLFSQLPGGGERWKGGGEVRGSFMRKRRKSGRVAKRA